MPLVDVRNVTKTFRKGDQAITPLSRCVDSTVEQGDFVSLMGASGSGKSTLLNLIAGIDRPDVAARSSSMARTSPSCRARGWPTGGPRHVGYIFQTHNLIPVLTAYENVELPLLLLPLTRASGSERVAIALEAVGLTDRADHYPRQLSGGQEQRVGIARAIVADPTVVVADEPTGDLDAETTEQILDLLAPTQRRSWAPRF